MFCLICVALKHVAYVKKHGAFVCIKIGHVSSLSLLIWGPSLIHRLHGAK